MFSLVHCANYNLYFITSNHSVYVVKIIKLSVTFRWSKVQVFILVRTHHVALIFGSLTSPLEKENNFTPVLCYNRVSNSICLLDLLTRDNYLLYILNYLSYFKCTSFTNSSSTLKRLMWKAWIKAITLIYLLLQYTWRNKFLHKSI